MCEDCAPAGGWRRRDLLGVTAGIVGLSLLADPKPVAALAPDGVAPNPTGTAGTGELVIRPRSAWAGNDRPPGPLQAETDVRIYGIHHTVSSNTYAADAVPGILRGMYDFHTGPDKGWPDIAYNFVVDRFGGVWETRAGSASAPVAGSATGGSQGFDQKCAFLGDHRVEPPTHAAVASMARLLAHLADRDALDTAPGAMATFTSRGSNRFAAGETVTVPTLAGHRLLSYTECPGDAAFEIITASLPSDVQAIRRGEDPFAEPPPPTADPTTTTTMTTAVPVEVDAGGTPAVATSPSSTDERSFGDEWGSRGVIGAAALAALAGLVRLRRR